MLITAIRPITHGLPVRDLSSRRPAALRRQGVVQRVLPTVYVRYNISYTLSQKETAVSTRLAIFELYQRGPQVTESDVPRGFAPIPLG